jgi:hypothetical protein
MAWRIVKQLTAAAMRNLVIVSRVGHIAAVHQLSIALFAPLVIMNVDPPQESR